MTRRINTFLAETGRGDLVNRLCVRLDMPRYAALGGWGMGPVQRGEVANKAREGREALTPVEAKAEKAALTALAAKGVEMNGPQQPFPAAPAAGPPDVPTVTPWALSPHHGHISPAQL